MKFLAFLNILVLVAFPENFLDPCDFHVTQDLAVKHRFRNPRAATSGNHKYDKVNLINYNFNIHNFYKHFNI